VRRVILLPQQLQRHVLVALQLRVDPGAVRRTTSRGLSSARLPDRRSSSVSSSCCASSHVPGGAHRAAVLRDRPLGQRERPADLARVLTGSIRSWISCLSLTDGDSRVRHRRRDPAWLVIAAILAAPTPPFPSDLVTQVPQHLEPIFSLPISGFQRLVSCNAKDRFSLSDHQLAPISSLVTVPRLSAILANIWGFLAPRLHAIHVLRAAEVVVVFRLSQPARWLAFLLAARHSGSEQYFCRRRRRGSRPNSFWQHRHRRRRV
jgi:hypothetical protein